MPSKKKCYSNEDIELAMLEEPTGHYTAEEVFDSLDEKLVTHFGDEYKKLANARRTRLNATGLWDFKEL